MHKCVHMCVCGGGGMALKNCEIRHLTRCTRNKCLTGLAMPTGLCRLLRCTESTPNPATTVQPRQRRSPKEDSAGRPAGRSRESKRHIGALSLVTFCGTLIIRTGRSTCVHQLSRRLHEGVVVHPSVVAGEVREVLFILIPLPRG